MALIGIEGGFAVRESPGESPRSSRKQYAIPLSLPQEHWVKIDVLH
jgi:hypothetical protein